MDAVVDYTKARDAALGARSKLAAAQLHLIQLQRSRAELVKYYQKEESNVSNEEREQKTVWLATDVKTGEGMVRCPAAEALRVIRLAETTAVAELESAAAQYERLEQVWQEKRAELSGEERR